LPHPLLRDLVVLFSLAVGAAIACHRLRIPLLAGFLVTGAVAGPHGAGLVHEVAAVEWLAEIGLVVLLFTIGVEFSVADLLDLKRPALLGGALQIGTTSLAGAALGIALGRSWPEALFLGFFLSLSSTAVVFRILETRAELTSPHGRATVGIALFQDLAAVPMLLLVPVLARRETGSVAGAFGGLLVGLAVVVAAVAAARKAVPALLLVVTRMRDREVFLLSVVVLIFGIAWMTSEAGLSLALGAFVAGVVLSESEFGHQALASLLPFRDVFTSLFFVSMGMLLDLPGQASRAAEIALLGVGLVLLKALLAFLSGALIGLPFRTAFLSALTLAQIGEFSFVLARSGLDRGLLTGEQFQTLLALSVLSLCATPALVAVGPRLVEWIQERRRAGPPGREEPAFEPRANHLIVIGFGLNGRNLCRAARRAGIPYVVLEINPDLVREAKASREPIVFGDGTERTVLERIGVREARVAVVAVSDPAATRRIVSQARRLAPGLRLIVRTRYVEEIGPLRELGADEVVPEEFETSIEIFTRVLRHYLVPEEEILALAAEVRAGGYDLLRKGRPAETTIEGRATGEPEIRTVEIGRGSFLDGRSLAEADLRRRFGVTVLAVRTRSDLLRSPDPDRRLEAGDRLVVIGSPREMARLLVALREKAKP